VPDDNKSPLEQALDLLVYAPIGAALAARDELPRFIEKGRERVTGQVMLAKMIGQFAFAQGQQEAQKAAEKLRQQAIETATRLAGAVPTPGPSVAPPAPRTPPAARVETDPIVRDHPPVSNGNQTAGAAAAAVSAGQAVAPARATATPLRSAVAAPSAGELAIPGYDTLSASQVVQRLAGLSTGELEAVRHYEQATRGRRTILAKVAQLQSGPAGP
jgi:hypothetical protein